MSQDAHEIAVMPETIHTTAAKPGAHAEPFASGGGWYLWLDGELVDISTNEMVVRVWVDAMNNRPNPFGVHPKGQLA